MLREETRTEAVETEWHDRCRYWATKADVTPARRRRERRTVPLIVTGHGLSVRINKGCLIVKGGNTHYPAEVGELRFFRGSLDAPSRIVAVDGSGTLTLDALDWMAEQDIVFVRINYDGTQSMAVSPACYTGNRDKVIWQQETRDNQKQQLEFAIETIDKKLGAALETIRNYLPKSDNQAAAIRITEKALSDLRKVATLPELLGIEGKAANAYWRSWHGIEMRWKSQTRYPIPDEWQQFRARSSVITGVRLKNLRASNPINAMLNYAYAFVLSEMRIRAIANGYDPMLGILHAQHGRRKVNTPGYALDLMEPFRPIVDRAVLRLVVEETFSGADFQLQSDGVCRLNPELARVVGGFATGALRLHRSF